MTSVGPDPECLDTAAAIGRRIAASALWSGDECTWMVSVPDFDALPESRAKQVVAGPAMYAGTAGIASFLTELYAITGDSEARRVAEGALRHALREGGALTPAAFGFFNGRVGIAHAAARFACVTGDDAHASAACDLVAPLFGREREDDGHDMIAGAAGAIPGLLRLAAWLDLAVARDSACALAEHVLELCRRGPRGWSVPGRKHYVRDLVGLAHGVAGFAHACMELYAELGDDVYRYAARQFFAYEQSVFDPSTGNWPDYRNGLLGDLMFAAADPTAAVADGLRRGTLPRWSDSSMVAWCHGAAGVGLTRFRAFEITGDDGYAEQGTVAVEKTLQAMAATAGSNYSLCHGAFGNCETLIAGARALGNSDWERDAATVVRDGIDRFERHGVPWPSGTVRAVPDPSLMLGDAGIGYFLLRFAAPETPSILLPQSCAPRRATGAVPRGRRDGGVVLVHRGDATEQFVRDVDAFFACTGRLFARLQPELPPIAEEVRASACAAGLSTAAAAHAVVECRIASAPPGSSLAAWLGDASLPDRTRYEMEACVANLTVDLFYRMLIEPVEAVDWNVVELRVRRDVRVVAWHWDWDAWYHSAPESEPIGRETWFLGYRTGGRAQVRPVSPFTAAVVEAARDGGTPSAIVDRLARRNFEAESIAEVGGMAALHAAAVAQLQSAWRSGIVVSAKAMERVDQVVGGMSP
ncbi:MAG TPA: lanthionine synthetase LanC family protein [Gemmatimonadaceae bacterium]|nr:lanthionine synthetase LanC family protein [Gemmatimonadaceae bacterium]